MTRTYLLPAATLAAATLLGGCGFMREHFGRKDPAYQQAPQDRPLEVPPDLDRPTESSALTIPPASSGSPQVLVLGAPPEAASTAPPPGPAAAAAAPAAPIAPGVAIDGGALRVNDTVESTFARVGLALERSGAASITTRDDAGHAYAVETTGQAAGEEPGWFKRAITFGQAGKKGTARVPLTVRVSADGTGSRVTIEGASDEASREAARALMATLRQRLS
ncbi:MAG: hypothetical protein J0H15_03885 [Xanthomonadales bacterium]|nr:hypothetical protein [Xanthomonadales bacterium]